MIHNAVIDVACHKGQRRRDVVEDVAIHGFIRAEKREYQRRSDEQTERILDEKRDALPPTPWPLGLLIYARK